MRVAFAAVVVIALAACPGNQPPQPPPLRPTPGFVPPDAGATTPIVLADAAPAPRAPGAACAGAADCDSGVCEGAGCGDDAPGHCAAEHRICTMELAPYCGCDGTTFQTSGSCPGRRYAHPGACASPPPPAKKAAGAACFGGDECETGVCEGQGCTDDAPGRCTAATTKCTRDARPYCGCDGTSFFGSGTCPGRRFAHKGKC